jgi:hypothetical protein
MKFTATLFSMILLLFFFTACENTAQDLFDNFDAFDGKTVHVCRTLKIKILARTMGGCEGAFDCCNHGEWFIGFTGEKDENRVFLTNKVPGGDECVPDKIGVYKFTDIGRELCVTGTFHKEMDQGSEYTKKSPYIIADKIEFMDESPKLDDGVKVTNELVLVEEGDFIQGEKTETINLKAFYIQKYEVTVRDFQECINAGICKNSVETKMYETFENFIGCNIGSERDADNPANCMSKSGAEAYCAWKNMRLPTANEWEKAARGVDGRKYPWGETYPDCTLTVMNNSVAGCGTYSTFPVGSKPEGASPYGIMDMSGNVSELIENGMVAGGSYGDGRNADGPDRFRSYNQFSAYEPNSIYVGFRCASDTLIF